VCVARNSARTARILLSVMLDLSSILRNSKRGGETGPERVAC
jgi:hypothetical protein